MTSEVTLEAELIQNDYEYVGKRWLSLTAEQQVKELTDKIARTDLICEMYLRTPLAFNSITVVKEIKLILEKALRGGL